MDVLVVPHLIVAFMALHYVSSKIKGELQEPHWHIPNRKKECQHYACPFIEFLRARDKCSSRAHPTFYT